MECMNFQTKMGNRRLRRYRTDFKTMEFKSVETERLGEYQHIFTHITWKIIAYKIKSKKKNTEFIWVSKKNR